MAGVDAKKYLHLLFVMYQELILKILQTFDATRLHLC